MFKVFTLTPGDEHSIKWDEFVDQDPNGSFFHLSNWQHVLIRLGHQCYYLYAMAEGNIVGVLPLARVRSRLFGDSLISTPFCVYGGALGSDEVKRFLEQQAIELANKLQVDHLELRYQKPQNNNLETRSQHAYFTCSLAANQELILAGIKKKQRAVVRQSLSQPLSITFDQSTDDFFDTYSESVRNLGTPVFAKSYFQSLLHYFPEHTEILTVRKDGKAVSSVLSFFYKGQVLPYYGGGIKAARELKSNDYMYFQLMCHAKVNKECNSYDFGRSKLDSGAYQYKKHWGMEPQLLPYQFHLVTAKKLPNLSPKNPKYQFFIKAWQRLPLSVSQWLGPMLSRYLG
ncbi:FemAB family XrtA/PEP-CTERM system-associated protein [Alishewanella tabrizica]|uniref:Peptidoglycan bridge formation protein FemAB n=1 Tax=Alishewanella tabrizica TaxID=671278 RepID=A0ABQ2WPR5_9ALTE|nr:FemAB family XrtA/PEP-CTERM system-associated protein [Alishewanella tabrizica]GGW62590.1 peptidoglycan bridge formation protein FemAB [Alishewanella tabrizica]